MSQAKATPDAVKAASISILKKGETLTVNAVLEKTKGSKTTVGRYLAEIREEMTTFLEQGMDLPPQLRETLIAFERTVWKGARTSADESFKVERDRLHRFLEEGERNLEDLMELNGALQETLESARLKIETLSALLAQRDKELTKSRKTVDALRGRADEATRSPLGSGAEAIMKELARIRQSLHLEEVDEPDDDSNQDGENLGDLLLHEDERMSNSGKSAAASRRKG